MSRPTTTTMSSPTPTPPPSSPTVKKFEAKKVLRKKFDFCDFLVSPSPLVNKTIKSNQNQRR